MIQASVKPKSQAPMRTAPSQIQTGNIQTRPQFVQGFQNFQPQIQYPLQQIGYPQYAQPQYQQPLQFQQGFARQSFQQPGFPFSQQQQLYPQQFNRGFPTQQFSTGAQQFPTGAPFQQLNRGIPPQIQKQALKQGPQLNQKPVSKTVIPAQEKPKNSVTQEKDLANTNPSADAQISAPVKTPYKPVNNPPQFRPQYIPPQGQQFQPSQINPIQSYASQHFTSQAHPFTMQSAHHGNYPSQVPFGLQSQSSPYRQPNYLTSPVRGSVFNNQLQQFPSPQQRQLLQNPYMSPQPLRMNVVNPSQANGQVPQRFLQQPVQAPIQKTQKAPVKSESQPEAQIQQQKSIESVKPLQQSPTKSVRTPDEKQVQETQNIVTQQSEDQKELEELALQYEDGFIYRGQGYQPQTRQGYGILADQSENEVYVGNWRDNYYHGEGKLNNLEQEDKSDPINWQDLTTIGNCWSSYKGNFNGGKMHGKGTLELSNGESYTGEFNEGMVDGAGTFTTQDGQEIKGTWDQGQYVTEE